MSEPDLAVDSPSRSTDLLVLSMLVDALVLEPPIRSTLLARKSAATASLAASRAKLP